MTATKNDLRSTLYDAIRELAYVQQTVVTSNGIAIIARGMGLLGVNDLSAKELPEASLRRENATTANNH